ncbi:hypothetical protein L228DRAFT_3581 [Xylona heveae TC161]|uniref:Uncharacterized protein n=1 Tax=Xylona heveae (strain CBS 132557 / TC161) TaxID=1328760 RepID=A0A165JC71_XYLHT|nr:hypothetical protein L228DRAFT_3581 [Xylona heveae TC161]KZF26041.1 hypothetical protein L228DRAFT_3581 [Xylona heveae TC161]
MLEKGLAAYSIAPAIRISIAALLILGVTPRDISIFTQSMVFFPLVPRSHCSFFCLKSLSFLFHSYILIFSFSFFFSCVGLYLPSFLSRIRFMNLDQGWSRNWGRSRSWSWNSIDISGQGFRFSLYLAFFWWQKKI